MRWRFQPPQFHRHRFAISFSRVEVAIVYACGYFDEAMNTYRLLAYYDA